ncbi:MAG: N-acetylglucosamine-6-phosphate deacetylase [Dehalococcoidia bacterium]|nr:N-acetylglucosamine-6-phosphate deacetylase [Dehalococcoidia bacterium]
MAKVPVAPLLVRNTTALLGGQLVPGMDLMLRDGLIAAVGPGLEAGDAAVFDARGAIAGPGLIDIHVHGGGGASFFSRDAAQLSRYASWAPSRGVTAFLASTAGRHPADTCRTLEGLAPLVGHTSGAELLGFHLEGPFLSPARHGAFDVETLREPDIAELGRYITTAEGHLRQVTLAPELAGALDVIRALGESGVVAALGHSDATTAEARAGFEAGATHVTHLFNAMRPVHQREGGIAVAALLESGATCELICDGAHVAPEMLRLAWALLGPERFVTVTDNLALAGTGGDAAEFLGGAVEVRGEAAVRPDGTITGSVLPMDGHFRNLYDLVGLDLPSAFAACAANPARVAGAGHRKGVIREGFDADIVLLDEARSVVATIARGALVYESASA